MRQLKTALSGAGPHWIYSIGLAALLSGCAGLPKFPTDRLWEFDSADKVCAEYQIVDPQRMLVKHLRDVPLQQCPPIFGFHYKDIAAVQGWLEKAQKWGREHCK